MDHTTENRADARYCDHYGQMTYADFLAWQAGGPETISQNGRGL